MRRWRGLKSLIHDAVDATVELVREGHESTSRSVMRVTDQVPPLSEPARAVDAIRRFGTSGVLGTIKLVNRSVQVVTDLGLDAALGEYDPETVPVALTGTAASPLHLVGDAALGLVNAAVGDHLHATDSGLDLAMELRAGDRYVRLTTEALRAALPNATPKVALFVHGLATTEWSWSLGSEQYHGDPAANFGTLLQRDLGFTPLFLRYNTGRHISESGRDLAAMLEALVRVYPAQPIELTLVGHSMGGLVIRSACHLGEEQGMAWTSAVRRAFYLGSPHQGAPLAQVGQAMTDLLLRVDLPATRIVGRILERRGKGVQDLRHSPMRDEHWDELTAPALAALPLPHASHHFISATLTQDPEHPVGRFFGDLLVRRPSASGPLMTSSSFAIDAEHHGGVWHHQVQNHPDVYARLRDLCAGKAYDSSNDAG